MKRSKKRRRSNNGFKLPLAIVAGLAPLTVNVLSTPGGIEPKGWMLAQALTGYDLRTGTWWFPNLMKGAIPLLLGIAVHKLAGKFGINRALAASGIPLIRV